MIYIAGPYSSDDWDVLVKRYRKHEMYTASLIRMQLVAYSPIVHGHEMAINYNLPKNYEFWQNHCLGMLAKADAVHVMMMDGWKESRGTQDEIRLANEMKIPVHYINDVFEGSLDI